MDQSQVFSTVTPKSLMRRLIALFTALLVSPLSPSLLATAQSEEPYRITVMSRNLYLGSDVGVALELIPNFPKAAQFMWDQVKKTDFSARAPKLAREAAQDRPEVIGIQEATIWYCKKDFFSDKVEVFNFLDEFIAATKQVGVGYSLATANGVDAFNPGYSIAAIPYLTKVTDPEIFNPIFGQDSAACGFTIGDALLVRDDVKNRIIQVGNTEFDTTYSIVPAIMTIYRGYTWVDFKVQDSVVRLISTHLESIWDENKVPNSALQAQQLVADLKDAKMPVIIMGDFNADYRDPRPVSDPNPGQQPVVSETCPTPGGAKCNAYSTMIEAGFENASPDAKNPRYFTWGAGALLDGPDKKRSKAAEEFGNQYGFTDRLDYIFTKNAYATVSSKIIGNVWPDGSGVWNCGTKICFPSDHAGVVATIELPRSAGAIDPDLPDHARSLIGFWHYIAIAFILIFVWGITRRIRRRSKNSD
jgi:endonuclease/exonuclease/phosphatase family metal-dependent hydrolase